MATIAEMAEAHLLNVEREINNLNARKADIDKEIDRLKAYLQEGRATLLESQSTQEVVPQPDVDPYGVRTYDHTRTTASG